MRDRHTMIELRRSGTRVRAGAVTLTHLASASSDDVVPRVAFAVGRRVGSAVVRNRLRRRLRALFRELASEPGRLPAGAYLVGVQPRAVTSTFAALRRDLHMSLNKIVASDPGPSALPGGRLVG